MTRPPSLAPIVPSDYHRHPLHAPSCVWVEKNCYVDVCIELLHALGLEPMAMFGATVAIDFEGDNFTFFKPSHDEMRELYGVDVQELNVWRPLLHHATEHLVAGRLISTEADAFALPDTDGTDYHRNHVKTTIILADLDAAQRRLGYFHNAGYFELFDDDFDRLFRVGVAPDPAVLPLFAELIKVDRLVKRPHDELVHLAHGYLARHLRRRPSRNPVAAFKRRVERDLPELQANGLPYYHAWAFATVRQLGAVCELLAMHLRWLSGEAELQAADDFDAVSRGAKSFILKAARAVNARRPLEATVLLDEMADAWQRGMTVLARGLPLAVAGR